VLGEEIIGCEDVFQDSGATAFREDVLEALGRGITEAARSVLRRVRERTSELSLTEREMELLDVHIVQ
jgi:hypothetical protein